MHFVERRLLDCTSVPTGKGACSNLVLHVRFVSVFIVFPVSKTVVLTHCPRLTIQVQSVPPVYSRSCVILQKNQRTPRKGGRVWDCLGQSMQRCWFLFSVFHSYDLAGIATRTGHGTAWPNALWKVQGQGYPLIGASGRSWERYYHRCKEQNSPGQGRSWLPVEESDCYSVHDNFAKKFEAHAEVTSCLGKGQAFCKY